MSQVSRITNQFNKAGLNPTVTFDPSEDQMDDVYTIVFEDLPNYEFGIQDGEGYRTPELVFDNGNDNDWWHLYLGSIGINTSFKTCVEAIIEHYTDMKKEEMK